MGDWVRDSIPRFAFYTLYTIDCWTWYSTLANSFLTTTYPAGYLLIHLETISHRLYQQKSFTTTISKASQKALVIARIRNRVSRGIAQKKSTAISNMPKSLHLGVQRPEQIQPTSTTCKLHRQRVVETSQTMQRIGSKQGTHFLASCP